MISWKKSLSILLVSMLMCTILPFTARGGMGDYTSFGNVKVIPRHGGVYYTGDYKVSLNLYSFDLNLKAWLNNSQTTIPKLDTLQAIKFAKEAGFDAVDVTAYYIPGYSNTEIPDKNTKQSILRYARDIKAYTKKLNIEISGTGVNNNFADPDDTKRAIDLKRLKFWIDVAAEMGAPDIRVFAGPILDDINKFGWEKITKDRIVPPLKELARYGATKGVKISLQNHGDMASTADQAIQIINWVNDPNIGIKNNTGDFRNFGSPNGLGYDWYADIQTALPYSINFQVKKSPAGEGTNIPMDLDRLFTIIRSSDYRGYLPIEMLWVPSDPGYPGNLPTPPYNEIKSFLAKLKASLEKTKTPGNIQPQKTPEDKT